MLGRQRQQYNVTVIKYKLQQKELSLNHNLMEEAPEAAGGSECSILMDALLFVQ